MDSEAGLHSKVIGIRVPKDGDGVGEDDLTMIADDVLVVHPLGLTAPESVSTGEPSGCRSVESM